MLAFCRGYFEYWEHKIAGSRRQKEITLGRYPDIPLAEARKIATTTRARVQQGIDVARQKQVARKVAERSWTIKKLADDYLEKSVGRLAPSTIKNRGQQLRSYVFPIIGHLSASEVSATDIVDIVERVSRKSLHVARLVLIVLREIFAHGVARHVIKSDPSTNIKANSIIGPRPVNRTRIMLTELELRTMLPTLSVIGAQNES